MVSSIIFDIDIASAGPFRTFSMYLWENAWEDIKCFFSFSKIV